MLDAVAITLLIGYSRLYMGDHFLTDVLAGYAFGLAWAGLVYTTLENYFGRYTRSRAAAVSSPLLRL